MLIDIVKLFSWKMYHDHVYVVDAYLFNLFMGVQYYINLLSYDTFVTLLNNI